MASATKKPVKLMKMTKEGYAGKCPSAFGSHAKMISAEWTEKVIDPDVVILEGDDGFYATTKDRLDTGLADPNRYASVDRRSDSLRKILTGVKVTRQEEKVILEVSV